MASWCPKSAAFQSEGRCSLWPGTITLTEATLVKALEEQGIGRPSTYAPTIATLRARNYVAIEERKLIPTELGFVVNDLLVEHFPNVFDIGFTSQMENELDDIASGDRAWVPTLRSFYDPFKNTLEIYVLREGTFGLTASCGEHDQAVAPTLPGLRFDTALAFAE